MSSSSVFKSPQGEAKYLAAYDATLALWPVPHQALDVETSFGTTHINIAGAADLPPLLLIHGVGLSSTQWYSNVAALSRHFRIYALDAIGQVGRSVRTHPRMTRAEYAAWLVEVLNALKIESASVMGHSYGGWLTLNLALAFPERIDRMVLLSPAGSFAPILWEFYLRGLAAALIPIRSLSYSVVQWTTTMPSVRGQAIVEQFVMGIEHFKFAAALRLLREQSAMGLLRFRSYFVYTDAELRQIDIPTLLLIGEQEVLYKPSFVMERARRLIPHIEAELIPGGGHMFPMDQADCTNTRILEFLNHR